MRDIINLIEGERLDEFVSFVKNHRDEKIPYLCNEKPEKVIDSLHRTPYQELRGLAYPSDGRVFWWDGDKCLHTPMERYLSREGGEHLYLRPVKSSSNDYKGCTAFICTYPEFEVPTEVLGMQQIRNLMATRTVAAAVFEMTDEDSEEQIKFVTIDEL